MICKTCNGTKRVLIKGPVYYNCECGGDCSEIPGWTKEDCKTCNTEECPDCKEK